jgi:DNA-binding winged helix-turn-helix (wHTH) protein
MSLDLKSNLHQISLSLVKPPGPAFYEFEGFCLDAEHLMLSQHGIEISLTPKQVDTLLAIIEKNGEIISKDVLMVRLWGNTSVEESNLIQNIYILRKVLRNTSTGKPMIETLRRRGYRFNAELHSNGKANREVLGRGTIDSKPSGPPIPLALVVDKTSVQKHAHVPSDVREQFPGNRIDRVGRCRTRSGIFGV